MTNLFLESFRTDIGQLVVVADESSLLYISLTEESKEDIIKRLNLSSSTVQFTTENRVTDQACEQINAYLAGQLKQFDLPLKIIGSDFQKLVLNQVSSIPFGSTKTYGEVAKAVGSEGAARAVGTTMATNRLPLIIPCHRVLASNGLGGYGGGLPMKKQLLKLEKENVS